MSIFDKLLPIIGSIGIPVGICLAGVALPVAYDLKGSVGRLEANLTNLERSQESEFRRLNKKIDVENANIVAISGRLKDRESDPAALMAKAGMVVEPDVTIVSVAGLPMTFPKNKEAEQRLKRYGYIRQEISPVISAYIPAMWNPTTFPNPALLPSQTPVSRPRK